MDSHKNRIRDEIQKNIRRYEVLLKRKVDIYRDTLTTREDIYEESRKLVENIIEQNKVVDNEVIEISLEALKVILEDMGEDEIEENQMFYPETGTVDFGYQIYHKKEFNQYQIPPQQGTSQDLDQLMVEKCSQGVKTSDTQKLLKNFLSPYTPYRSLLVYHGVGVGKTCASIMIAENYKNELEKKNKKIFIILPPSIQENYKRQIIDISKISSPNKKIQKQCTGDTYMTPKFIQKLKKLKLPNGKHNMEEIQRLANKLIDKNYVFLGYEKFVHIITKIEEMVLKRNPETRRKKGAELKKIRQNLVKKKIQDLFSDSLIIIDEAHNITAKDEGFKKGKDDPYQRPIEEENDFTNLEDIEEIEEEIKDNTNSQEGGGRSKKDEFDLESELTSNSTEKNSGSFWDEETDTETILSSDNMTTLADKENYQEKIGKQFPPTIKKVLQTAENIKLVLLTATPMFNTAEEIVDLVNLLLLNDGEPLLDKKEIFKNGDLTRKGKEIFKNKISGYISYLRGENPVNFPQKLDPLPEDGLYLKKYPSYDVNGNKLTTKIKFLKTVECEMSSVQWTVYQKFFETRKEEGNYFDTVGLQVCNLVCVDNINLQKEDIFAINNYYGTKGFNNIINSDVKKNKVKLAFKNDKVKELFELSNLHHISIKLQKIIQGIEKSKGICFVYSQFLWSGIFPMAIALELLGYSNYGGSNLLPSSYKIPKKKITVTLENGEKVERNMKYLIIKGGSSEDFDKYKKNDEINNMDGSLLKIVLGTKAAGEGLNIYHVREVHVLEPWFHLNRLEQVVGRGIRNCSHTNLPAEERNVSVFLYTVTEPKTKNRQMRETLDMKLYRVAEEKIGKIGKVMEIVKSASIDCHLNQEGNSFLNKRWKEPIKMTDSRGNTRMVSVEDKPYTNMCNYSDKCQIKCNPVHKKIKPGKLDMSTYRKEFSEDNIKNCMEEIANLFSNHEFHIVFTLKEISKYLQQKIRNIETEIIFQSLNVLVKEDIKVFDYQGNEGKIIYRGSKNGEKYYIFQPYNLTEEVPIILRKLRFDTKINKIRLEKLIFKKTMKENKKEIIVDEAQVLNKFLKLFEKDTNKTPNANMIQIISKNLEQELGIKCERNSAKCIHNILVEKYFDYYPKKERRIILEYILTPIVRILENDMSKLAREIKKVSRIDFYQFDELRNNFLISRILEEIEYENQDLEVRNKYVRGLIRYLLTNNCEYNQDNNKRLDTNYFGYSLGVEESINFYTWKEGQFMEADKKEVSVLATIKDKKKIMMESNSDIYGFCEMQSKTQKNLKFKIVEKNKEKGTKKTQEVTGSTCGPAYDLEGHIRILKSLDYTDMVSKLQKKTEKIGKKTDICAGIEILLRINNYIRSQTYFYNYENSLIWKNKY